MTAPEPPAPAGALAPTVTVRLDRFNTFRHNVFIGPPLCAARRNPMRNFLVPLAALVLVGGLALLAPTAAAKTDVALAAKETQCGTGKTFCFETTTTTIAPGPVTVTLNNPSTNAAPHNVCVKVGTTTTCKPGPSSGDTIAPGATTTLDFTAPASGTVEYWCEPHKTIGMAGSFTVQGVSAGDSTGGNTDTSSGGPTNTGGSGGQTRGSPGVGVVSMALGVALLALVLRRRA